MLLSMARYLLGAGIDESANSWDNPDIAFCKDIPKFIFTKTTREICDKINITGKTISMIEEASEIETIKNGQDVFAHISLPREFFRYMIINQNIYVIHLYLHKNPALHPTDDYIGYSCWHIGLGGKPEDYIVDDYHKKFFQILIFLKYTEPDVKIIPSGKKVGTKKHGYFNLTTNDIQVVDSTWNTTVIRTEGFSVDGHLRLQPCGEGRKKRKLIWIEPFEKHGYVRNAKSEMV